MPLTRIRTVRYVRPSAKGSRKKISIPQPEERALSLRRRDVVQWRNINLDPWWFTTHRRGVRRAKIGEDPLEARAVSRSAVNGTLPERIVYQYLVTQLHMTPTNVNNLTKNTSSYLNAGVFDFQSSVQGGRMELGGIVADFIFPMLNMVIQVQGPTHDTFLRSRKDSEQMDDLSAMGYDVLLLDDGIIYDEYLFEEWMRRAFGLANGMGGSGGALGPHQSDQDIWVLALAKARQVASTFYSIFGDLSGYARRDLGSVTKTRR